MDNGALVGMKRVQLVESERESASFLGCLLDLILIESANGVILNDVQLDLRSEQIPNMLDTIDQHRLTLETETPRDHTNILWKAHRSQHLWTKHTGVT